MKDSNTTEVTAIHALRPEQRGTNNALEEGRRYSKYLAPMTDSPGGSNKAGLALVGTPNHDLTMSFKSSGGPCTGIPEPGGTTRESLMGGQALTRQNGQRCFREGRHSSHGEGVYDRETKAKSVCSETETVLELDRRGADRDSNEKEEEDESVQQKMIGWIQVRHREFAILISLGCVVTTFVNYLMNVPFTASVAVTFIPVAVNLLLTWDIYVKWDERRRRRRLQRVLHGGDIFGDSGVSGRKDRGKPSASYANGRHSVGQPTVPIGADTGTGGTLEVTLARDKGRNGERRGRSARSPESNGSQSSSSHSSVWDINRSTGSGEVGNDEDDLWDTNLDSARSDECNIRYLETSYRKSIHLLYRASESIQDPSIRQQLEDIAAMLSGPDSLLSVKEDVLRRSATERGTQSYIDNVLGISPKTPSAESNGRKLFIRSMVEGAALKEVAGRESPARPAKGSITIEADKAKVVGDRIKNGLDEKLGCVAGSATSTCDSRGNSMGTDLRDWNEEKRASFDQLNQVVIQEQQLVAKAISQGNAGKELDRMSVRELRDIPCNTTFGVKKLESLPGEGYVEPDGASSSKSKKISVLPTLREEHMDAVAALIANGRFLSWEFNVFDLEELSGGHSLWYSAMSSLYHYNLIGAFGLSADRLNRLFLCVEATYCYDPKKPNIYHTHVHAADVTLTVAHFLSVETITSTVRSMHSMALLMAAIMHDYRHPGVNNSYLIRHLDPLAVIYNDSSVLENFHASEGFKLMMDPRFDIFKGWKYEDVKYFRQAYVKCILATDLALSLDYISKFQSLHIPREGSKGSFSSLSGIAGNNGKPGSFGGGSLGGKKGSVRDNSILKTTCARAGESVQNQILLLQMVLKVADVAHPCKPWEIHRKWSNLVTEEFFKQGDMELAYGLAVSPLCDRREENLPKSQCDFIDFIVRPCVTMFSSYCKVSTWNEHLESNFRQWKKLLEEQDGASNASSPAGSRRRSQR